jgi:hypothetical protein
VPQGAKTTAGAVIATRRVSGRAFPLPPRGAIR